MVSAWIGAARSLLRLHPQGKDGVAVTALKPIENRNVRGVPSEEYPLGTICAHPECTNTDVTAHHIFPRSLIKSKSWFVQVEAGEIFPHVVPLCGSGTTGHHGDIEEHRAWIKMEGKEFVWYDQTNEDHANSQGSGKVWTSVGALNPQPAYGDGKPKRRKTATSPAEKKAKVTYSIKTPKDEENVLPELEETLRDEFREEMGWKEDVPAYFVWVAAAAKALQ
jgi:hypothetical protein